MIAKLQASLAFKLCVTSFASTHLPLVVAIVYFSQNQDLEPRAVFSLLLAATVAGTVLSLGSLWYFLYPLRQLRAAIIAFRKSRVVCDLPSRRKDEIGLIIRAFTNLTAELSRTLSTLEHQATSDIVTGLRNRRWLVENAAVAISRAGREKLNIALIAMDLDKFKTINDRYGHDVGDRALTAAGAVLLSCLRPYDLAARTGGEEFVILLPGCDRKAASEIANRIRMQLAELKVLPDDAKLTASLGVYEADPTADNLSTMLKAADANLYEAKRMGRNKVVSSSAMFECPD